MRRTGLLLLAAALLLGASAGGLLLPGRASADPIGPPPSLEATPGVSGTQMRQLQDYGAQVGEDWLRDTLGVDLPGLGTEVQDSVQQAWDQDGWGDVDQDGGEGEGGSGPQGLSPSASASAGAKGVSVRVAQTGGLSQLSQGLRDVPFGAEVRDNFQLGPSAPTLHTRLSIPLSPDGTWKAEARMPLRLSATARSWWWRSLGLGNAVSLNSDLSSRLGFNQVEAGLGTDWRPGFWGVWNLDYAFQVNYGQGSNAAVNWLKVSKRF